MKRCDCEHYEICPTCFPQGFDEDGNRKPVERPPTRAELVEKIAELTSAIDEQMVVTHLGVFNPGDDPKVAIHRLMCWSQDVGEYFAKDKLAALEAKCATLEPVIRAIGNFIGRKYLIAWNEESLSDLVIQLLTERDKQLADALPPTQGHPL